MKAQLNPPRHWQYTPSKGTEVHRSSYFVFFLCSSQHVSASAWTRLAQLVGILQVFSEGRLRPVQSDAIPMPAHRNKNHLLATGTYLPTVSERFSLPPPPPSRTTDNLSTVYVLSPDAVKTSPPWK